MSGDVRILVETWMPERLIQRATTLGLRLLYVERPDSHALIVEANARDARRLIELCRRFSIPAQVIARRRGSALGRRLRARWSLLVAGALAVALCATFLSRLWRIEIAFTGEAAALGRAGIFTQALRELGVHPGISGSIDTRWLSDELLARAEGYSYVGARRDGVCLRIEAAPEVPAPAVYDIDAGTDLYASRTGIVVSVNVESGQACVKPGDTVRKGQLLIRGEEQLAKDETRRIGAMGQVIIRTWFEGRAAGALSRAQISYTGRRSESARLLTPWFEVPVHRGEGFESQSVSTRRTPIVGLFLPVCVERKTARETRATVETGDRAILASRIAALAMADARAALPGAGSEDYAIARSWVRFSQSDGDLLSAEAIYEIHTNVAVARLDTPEGG